MFVREFIMGHTAKMLDAQALMKLQYSYYENFLKDSIKFRINVRDLGSNDFGAP